MRRIILILLCTLWLLAGCQQMPEFELPEFELPEWELSEFNPIETVVNYLNSTGIEEEFWPEEVDDTEEGDEFFEDELEPLLYPDLVQKIMTLEEASQVSLPAVYALDVAGTLTIDSTHSTVVLFEELHKRFVQEGYQDIIKINPISTESAIQFYCRNADIQILQTDRLMTERELQDCMDNNRLPIAFSLLTDAIAIVVHPENDFVEDVSVAELAQIFQAEKWSDVNETWPNLSVERFIPEPESSTATHFAKIIMEQEPSQFSALDNTISDEDVAVLSQNISQIPGAIGFFSYAHYYHNRDSLKLIALDGQVPINLPIDEFESAEINEDYPLALTLQLYADMNLLQQQENVRTFVNFALTHSYEEGLPLGYLPLETTTWDGAKAKFIQGTTQGITVLGSTTVAPWVERGYEHFIESGFTTDVTIQKGGSTAGIEKFCELDSKIDIGMASRSIRADEKETCQANGRDPFEVRVGTDMLAVIFNRGNTFISEDGVSAEELAKIFTLERWSDVNAEWPDEPIERFIPTPATGEFGFFTERILNDGTTDLENVLNTTLDDEETNLIDGIQNNVYAVGFMGYSHYIKRASDLSLMAINGNRPDLAIENDEPYLLARPLNLYIDSASLQHKPQLAAFITFQLEHGDEYLDALGYVPLNSQAKESIRRNLLPLFIANQN